VAKFEEGGCPCEPVEEDEPLHVVDKFWDPILLSPWRSR
jgi:hypothetical protein